MKIIKTLLLFTLITVLMTGSASAANIDSAKNTFDFAGDVIADKRVEGDYVAVGGTVKLESGVGGDIIAAGRTVTITDENAVQNIYAAGQYVTVRAKSVRNIYAAGGDITVNNGTEAGGVYLVGGSISFGGTANDVYLAGVSVKADGMVYENLVIRSDHITFGKNVTVNGRVTIYATVKPKLPPNIDESKVTFKKIILREKGNEQLSEKGISRLAVLLAASTVVASGFLAFLLTLFRGAWFKARANELKKRAGKSILFGLIAFIVIPVAAIVCMLTVFAIPVSIIVLMLYGIVLYLSPVISGIIVGRLVLGRMNRFLSAILGAAVITLLMLVPILKVVLFLASAFYTLGIIVIGLKPRRENVASGEISST